MVNSTYSKKRTTRAKRSDSKQHLLCEYPGCANTQCAKGLCYNHWKQARLALMTQPERRAYIRKVQNELPRPTRPEPTACECCRKPLKAVGKRTEVPQLDHDHLTGEFRGWLCYACNLGIGFLGDNVQGIQRAMGYLTSINGELHDGKV